MFEDFRSFRGDQKYHSNNNVAPQTDKGNLRSSNTSLFLRWSRRRESPNQYSADPGSSPNDALKKVQREGSKMGCPAFSVPGIPWVTLAQELP